MKNFIFYLFFTFISIANTQAATWYVNHLAAGNNDGTSWQNAFTDLQNAIAAATFGDEIWVAQGTYKPTATTSRTIYFSIKNGTKVYGGFFGNETLLTERNIQLYETKLSGEIGTGAATDNSYHVVYFGSVGNQTELNGFTITGGYSSTSASIGGNDGLGGGIYSRNSSPTIANCKIVGNFATEFGGGLAHVTSGNLTVKNCVFDGNISGDDGAALYLNTGTNTVTDCYIKNNQAGDGGGGFYLNNSTNTIDRCVIAGNTCVSIGSAIYFGNEGKLVLSNSLLVGNFANGSNSIYLPPISNPHAQKMINCTVAHNKQSGTSSTSSSIVFNNASLIENSIIYENSGVNQVSHTGVTIRNSILGTSVATGVNVINTNPLFVLPGTVMNAPFDTTGLNYRLDLFSPGIDKGANSVIVGNQDLVGSQRIHNTTVDLGAYENEFCTSNLIISPNGPYVLCGTESLILSVEDATGLTWSSGSTSNDLTVTSAGTYSVVYRDVNGCRGFAEAVVTSSAVPTPTISFSNGNLVTGTFATYQWYFNNTMISGATGSTHVPLEGYGNYRVDVTSSAGCEGSVSYCFSPVTLTASGPVSFCAGESVTLTANEGANYVWSTGSINPSITVTQSGTYSVTVMNATAACAVNLSQTVNVTPNPVPTISLLGELLTTQPAASYQWYMNGNLIAGATSQTYEPTENNSYTVKVTNNEDCEGTSSVYVLNNLSVNAITETDFSIYPNPLKGDGLLTITGDESFSKLVYFKLLDVTGKLIKSFETVTLPISIQLPNLPAGIYFVVPESELGIHSKLKVVIHE